MSTEIICNRTGRELRVALIEHGQLAELNIDRGDNRGFVGNIYLGRVVRVLPGMQAAFVEIGLERAAFLYVGDIHADVLHLHTDDDQRPEPPPEKKTTGKGRGGQPPIQDLLKEGQEVVVQISKDPIGTKGARLTMQIALPGRFMVYMPTVEHVGISRRIDKDKERRRLRDFVEKHRPKGAGFIVRTVCAGQPTERLEDDMEFLMRSWERIQAAAKEKKAPAVLHAEYGVLLRMVRDLMDDDVSRVVVDDRPLFEEVRTFMGDFMPKLKDRVHLYRGKEPVFETFGVETQIRKSLGRKVWLKSGGYLVIDQTEALMAIDVNSGKFVGKTSLEDTTLQLNLEAVEEVAYQLRLRNIGGLIIIDFIDMDKEAHREKVYRTLEEALRRDRARTNVLRISDLGLVEMTRKRVQEGLDRYLTEPCPTCGGTGVVQAKSSLCYEILREVQRESARAGSATVVHVNTTAALADLLYGAHYAELEQAEADIGKRIVVRALGHFHPEQYEVYVR